jgi:hypothetical protein
MSAALPSSTIDAALRALRLGCEGGHAVVAVSERGRLQPLLPSWKELLGQALQATCFCPLLT